MNGRRHVPVLHQIQFFVGRQFGINKQPGNINSSDGQQVKYQIWETGGEAFERWLHVIIHYYYGALRFAPKALGTLFHRDLH